MVKHETRDAAVPPVTAEAYEPPAVAWEEPFDPVAASDPLNPDCILAPELCPPPR